MSFYRLWAAAGLNGKIPIASTTFGNGNEHIVLSPEEGNGILIAQNYIQDLVTETNVSFVEAFHKRFGNTTPTKASCYGPKLFTERVVLAVIKSYWRWRRSWG